MRLLNFELGALPFGIELIGRDFFVDVHNTANFRSIVLDATTNAAVMTWDKCSLSFTGLKLLNISARDEELPLTEDSCVSSISKVTPGPERLDFRVKEHWNIDEPFHLWFQSKVADRSKSTPRPRNYKG